MELLSPAGSYEALLAAVQNGADAVYMGLGGFNARRSARNFTDEDFARAVDYCHERGVKVYLTLNTLLTDRELPEAAEVLKKASAWGVDAVLVQDWGLWQLARLVAPDQPLHASTQMSLHTLSGARLAAELGMERVVLARELPNRDVETICRGCGAEVEVFGHGALCMCYSGQCAMSAMIGGRSGNRGTCAQPCRLPYTVGEKTGYLLSLKDNNLSPYLRQMEEMGVSCVKLEGRMKRPEYVAAVTGIYRRLLDEKRPPSPTEQAQLERAFSRSGFTDGYWTGRRGAKMFGMRPESARWPEDWFAQVRKTYEGGAENRPVAVDFTCRIAAGEEAALTAALPDGRSVTVTGPVPEAARSRSLTEEELRTRLQKTGGTVFACRKIDISLSGGLMLSAGSINALRRDALAGLRVLLTSMPQRRTFDTPALPAAPAAYTGAPKLTASVTYAHQLTTELARGVEYLYLPLALLGEIDLDEYAGYTKLCAVLPRILRTEDEGKFREVLQEHPQLTAVAVSNLGHLPIVDGLGLEVRGDLGLNVFNSRALLLMQELGLESVTVSAELRHQQVRDLRKYIPCEAVVYGRLPLMVTENCPLRCSGQCSAGSGGVLTDRTGARFPVLCGHSCRPEIQNSRPLYLADKPEWKKCGLRWARLRLTTETAEEALDILQRYQGSDFPAPAGFTRGPFYRGVE
ncbi:MAG: DUF3656 domain-containing U32 family peptidase [Oscillospiraceae bacterium]